jgi:S-adenosylmethionine synthetase
MNPRHRRGRLVAAESVTEGHPDKIADYIADSVLDAFLERDPRSRVACNALCKSGTVVLAGEITSRASDVDFELVVRQALRELGYSDPDEEFSADRVKVEVIVSPQAAEIAHGVGGRDAGPERLGAGDQSIVIGYASKETPELMPLPIALAHALTAGLARHRKEGRAPWLRPDGKSLVAVQYAGPEPAEVAAVLVSAQHAPDAALATVREYVQDALVPDALAHWAPSPDKILVNPAGTFHRGGPSVDCGLTGRKSVMDSYGPSVPHGGGAFSGKDPTKVDRSGAYFARYAARRIVASGIADRAEVQMSYAIGRPQPLSVAVDTFGTGDAKDARALAKKLDYRPGAIIDALGLFAPIYRGTSNYGHFGRPGLPWEAA